MILFSNCGAGAGLVKFAREGREMKGFRWIGQNTKQTPSVGRSLFEEETDSLICSRCSWFQVPLLTLWVFDRNLIRGTEEEVGSQNAFCGSNLAGLEDWRAFSVSCWTTWLWCESNVARATEVSGCQVLAPRLEEQEHLSWCKLYTGWCTLCTGLCALHLTTLYLLPLPMLMPMPMPLVVCIVHCTQLLFNTYLCPTPPYYPTEYPIAQVHSAHCSSVLHLLMTENSAFEHLNKVRVSNFWTRAGG